MRSSSAPLRPAPAARILASLVVAVAYGLLPLPAAAAPINVLDRFETPDARLQGVLEALQAGRTGQARARLEAILAGNPENAPAQELLGVIRAREGDLDGAIAAFERAVELDPRQFTALTKLGDVHLAKGARETARRYFTRALEIDPTDRLSHQRLGILAEEDGDIAAAIRHFEAGIRGMPEGVLGVRINLALLYNRAGTPQRTLELLAPFAARGDAPALVRRALGNAHLALGDAEAAIAEYRQGLARASDDAAMRLGFATALLQTGAAAAAGEAVEVLAPLHAADPAEDAVALTLARARAATGDAEGARAVLEATLAVADHAAPELYLDLGALQQAAGDLEAAAATYAAMQRAHPGNAAGHLAQGALLGLQRRYAEALAAFEAGLALDPEHPGLLRGALRAHQQEGRLAAARDLGRRLSASGAVQATDLFYLGTLEEATGGIAQAILAYERALERDPDFWPALNNLAVLLLDRDSAQAALPLAERAQALRPDHPAVNHTLGLALLRNGRAAEAEPILRAALQMAPGNPAYLHSLAEAAAVQGRADEARDLLERALEAGLDPGEAAALAARIDG